MEPTIAPKKRWRPRRCRHKAPLKFLSLERWEPGHLGDMEWIRNGVNDAGIHRAVLAMPLLRALIAAGPLRSDHRVGVGGRVHDIRQSTGNARDTPVSAACRSVRHGAPLPILLHNPWLIVGSRSRRCSGVGGHVFISRLRVLLTPPFGLFPGVLLRPLPPPPGNGKYGHVVMYVGAGQPAGKPALPDSRPV